MKTNEINKLVIDSSGTTYGNAVFIDRLHNSFGRRKDTTIDYNYVIVNGRITAGASYQKWIDGNVETGRPIGCGSHKNDGNNRNTIKICMIGEDNDFTITQLIALRTLIWALENSFDLSHNQVFGYHELDIKNKSSHPIFDMDDFRLFLEDKDKVVLLGKGNCGCKKKVRHG